MDFIRNEKREKELRRRGLEDCIVISAAPDSTGITVYCIGEHLTCEEIETAELWTKILQFCNDNKSLISDLRRKNKSGEEIATEIIAGLKKLNLG